MDFKFNDQTKSTRSELEKFQALFHGLPAAIALLHGPDFVFEMANDAYLKIVGRKNIVGKPLVVALPEIQNTPFPQILQRVLTTGEAYSAREQEVLLRHDESEDQPSNRFYLDFTYSRILDSQGKPYGVFVFAVDITEKVLARASVQLEQVKLEAVFASASAALAILRGPEAIYERTNASYEGLFVNRPLLGLPLLEALPELRGQKFPDLVSSVFATGERYIESEAHAFLKRTTDGELEERFFDQSYSRIADRDGIPYGVLIQATDVTERVSNRRKLEAALDARDNFLSVASHELRTPITAMKLQTQIMKRSIDRNDPTAYSPERVSRLVENTERSLNRMNHLVEDMLDIARIQAGKLSLQCETTDLISFVHEVADRYHEGFTAAGIDLTIHSDKDSIPVSIDLFRIEQILANLITNAIKYAPNAPVSISLSTEDGTARLAFKDHGPGVAPDDLERIFQRFERLVSHGNVSGMGLGLYIVRQIAVAHGGKIFAQIDSTPGAKFVLELPLAAGS